MNFGDNMMLLRKKKGLSQAALGKVIGTSGDVIGRYERGDITPSIEVASKIADVLETSIDFLIGKTAVTIDKQSLKRLEDIEALPDQEKQHILFAIDNMIKGAKLKNL